MIAASPGEALVGRSAEARGRGPMVALLPRAGRHVTAAPSNWT